MVVIWSKKAFSDLKGIHEHIAKDSTFYAKKVSQNIYEKTQNLRLAPPQIGKKVPEFNDKNIREKSIYSYRIIYRIQPTTINIIAVVHKRQILNIDEL